MAAVPVDLAVNAFERTYRTVLSEAYVEGLRDSQGRVLSRILILISNVEDEVDAARRAEGVAGLPDVVVRWVRDDIERALRLTGLSRRRLGKMFWYSAAPLAAIAAPGADWLVYWDADVQLASVVDWITPSIELLQGRPELLVANPSWTDPHADSSLARETLWVEGDFAVGRGFSDQAFLVRRSSLAAPVYRYVAPASWRYPTAPHGAIFEQRVDAYMRRKGLLRATYLRATYRHPHGDPRYPPSALVGVRRRLLPAALRLGCRLSGHPALRP